MSSSASRVGFPGALGPRKRGVKFCPSQWRRMLPVPTTHVSSALGPHTPVRFCGTPLLTELKLPPCAWYAAPPRPVVHTFDEPVPHTASRSLGGRGSSVTGCHEPM